MISFKEKAKHVLWSTLSPLLLVAIWETGANNQWFSALYFPPPSAIAARFFDLLIKEPAFLQNIVASLYRLGIGAAISIGPAILLAISMGLNKYVELFFKPLIAITYPIPKLAVFPLLLVICGIGDESKIALIALGIFYMVLLSTVLGVQRLISSGYFDIVKVYKIPFGTKLWRVLMRGTLPEILNGIKIGLGYGLIMVVAGEYTVSKDGIGFFMWNAWDQFRIKDLYCGLVVLSALGLFFFFTFDAIQKRLKELKPETIE